jgi:hypothetical protein
VIQIGINNRRAIAGLSAGHGITHFVIAILIAITPSGKTPQGGFTA